MIFTTLASLPLTIWKALEEEGCDPDTVFKRADADVDLIGKPGARYPTSVITRLWDEATKVSSSECLGLAAANQWHPTTFHALGIAWLASPTIKEALHRLVRHSAMLDTAVVVSLDKQGDVYCLSIKLKSDDLIVHPETGHAAMAAIIHICRESLGQDFNPIEVHLMQPASSCINALKSYFGCSVLFNRKFYALFLASKDVDQKLPTANHDLLASADLIIADYINKLDTDNIISRARLEIMKQLPSGQITEESIANSLSMSLRTFQRRLNERNQSYRPLLESVRKELAIKYIADPKYSITEITYLLGFSEPSSFSRSFKRWTGNSPSSHRNIN